MALASKDVRLVGLWPSKVAVAVARALQVEPPRVVTIAVDRKWNELAWKLERFDVAYPHFRRQAGLPV